MNRVISIVARKRHATPHGISAHRLHFPPRFAAALFQSSEELLRVFVVPENILALVTAVQDVVNGSGILKALLTLHAQATISAPKFDFCE